MMKQMKHILIVFFAAIYSVSLVLAEDKSPPEIKDTMVHIGAVQEIYGTEKYIYMLIEEEGREVWLAVMSDFIKDKLIVGDKVEYLVGNTIKEFSSITLDKTFDSLHFVTHIRIYTESPESMQPYRRNNDRRNNSSIHKEVREPAKGEIKTAIWRKSIEEIFIEKDNLKNKTVVLKARVMRVSKYIMGKSWVTLQDGTGSAPDNKIMAVTRDAVSEGDLLTVEGILRTNVDLGSGYKYKVLIEEAKFTK